MEMGGPSLAGTQRGPGGSPPPPRKLAGGPGVRGSSEARAGRPGSPRGVRLGGLLIWGSQSGHDGLRAQGPAQPRTERASNQLRAQPWTATLEGATRGLPKPGAWTHPLLGAPRRGCPLALTGLLAPRAGRTPRLQASWTPRHSRAASPGAEPADTAATRVNYSWGAWVCSQDLLCPREQWGEHRGKVPRAKLFLIIPSKY